MKRPLAGVLQLLLALATAGGLLVGAPGPASAAPGWTPPRVVADDMRPHRVAAASAGGPVVLVNHREMVHSHQGRDTFATMWVTVRR
ncbi:hypothetical protein GGQ22_03425 [Nocardioides sp. zg-579]|uniref:Uncharacterized protein n=1 Tax=Nocardioides marmotae TaxID=2663857 RepID=A0A6I3J4W7_9ACTN|nr:hypothetical protein [Nocardioides marmotae]MCR6030488.1 hypothetical protein [Gordonia jinghuaiqii]MTB94124.1 hypothetical protein [Nocardioides marmotae]QKE00420.1 hypothetical protein HPC71_04505 [Nocardioides marmotae]